MMVRFESRNTPQQTSRPAESVQPIRSEADGHTPVGSTEYEELRERIATLAEENRRKDEFLATLSHELRTPLSAMLGWVQLLRTSRVDAEAFDRALAIIERNASVQTRLVNDLLDVSRIIAGRFT